MQERINRIGFSLVPSYQRNLPESDTSKILFRFQLVDEPKWDDAYSLPSGIIIVPGQLVELLPNDSELAAVLTDNIANVLEKQSYRLTSGFRAVTVGTIAADAALIGIPGLGIGIFAAANSSAHQMTLNVYDQRGRVALGLIHDAGLTIEEAPLAWWKIAGRHKKDLRSTRLPLRAANLYKAIGVTWRSYPAVPPQTNNGTRLRAAEESLRR